MYSHTAIIKSQNNKFPKNRDFYLLDKEDNIKYFPKTLFDDPDHICVSYVGNNNKICERSLKKRDFEYKYNLVRIEVINSDTYINFIIPKNVLNDANSEIRLLSEIKQRHSLIKEIKVKTKIDFNKRGNYLKEISFIPIEKRFYDKIFTLYDNTKASTPIPNNKNRYSDNNIRNDLNNGNYLNKSGIFNIAGNNIISSDNNYEDTYKFMNKINMRGNNTQLNNNNIINYQNNYNSQNKSYFRNNCIPNNNGNNYNSFRSSNIFNQDNKNNPDYFSSSYFNNSNSNNKPITLQIFNPLANKNKYDIKPIPEDSNLQTGNNSNQTTPPPPPSPIPNQNIQYIFPKKGLRNIGSTCYMNATLQCLLHVNELIIYFIDEYPKDKRTLNEINRNVKSKGEISNAFYNLVKGVYDQDNSSILKNELKAKTGFLKSISNIFNSWSGISFNNYYSNANVFSPDEFKRTLGNYNSQFRRFEANDSKDLILYLLQTMHDELNYFGNKNQRLKYMPNQYNIVYTYQHFTTNYNSNNFSKISLLFYGTYINTTTCKKCGNVLYNFPKFEFISFGMIYYHRKKFNILNGFKDNSKPSLLTGDNKYLCKICNELQEAEIICKIYEPPNKLLINIDYGKNKIYQPSSIDFDEEIDITQFIPFDYKQKIRYRIIGVCTHYGYSGQSGHYVAFCKNKKENRWYEFDDSSCHECNNNNIYGGSPYLLLYERIYN